MKTKKVMYNNCYGGFAISNFAKVEYVKRVWKNKSFKICRVISNEDITRLINLNEKLTNDEIYFIDDQGNRFKFPNWEYDYKYRRDPILISLLEEYGSRKISANYSEIQIEVLDETDRWKIVEVEDGFEEVRTLNLNGWYN